MEESERRAAATGSAERDGEAGAVRPKAARRLRLSDAQWSTVAAAITIVAAAVIVAAIGAILWLLANFLQRFSTVFLPLAVAAVAALVFDPYYEWLCHRLRLPPVAAVGMVFLSILVPVAGLLWFFGDLLVEQIVDLVARVPEWWREGSEFVRERWPRVQEFFASNPWGQRIRTAVEGSGGAVAEGVGALGETLRSVGTVMARAVGKALAWAVLPVYFGFFLMAPGWMDNVKEHLPFLKSETRRDLVYLGREFINILVAFFRGQLIVALLQGILFTIGFSLVGLRYGAVLGLVLGFLNIIPYLGSIVGLAVALPLAFFQNGGGLATVGLVLLVFTAVQMIEGYLLTPKIMGDRTGLHPVAIIVAVFFWGSALGGIAGMILAIPLTAFLVVFWRLVREKYVREIV